MTSNSTVLNTLDEISIESIQVMSNSISNESIFGDVTSALYKLPTLLSGTRRILKHLETNKFSNDEEYHLDVMGMRRDVQSKQYVALMDRLVAVPEGFTGNYIQYTKLLLVSAKTIELAIGTQVDTFTHWLAARVGAVETFAPITNATVNNYKKQEIAKLVVEISKCFGSKGVQHSKRPYRTVVRRQQDWYESLNYFEQAKQIFSKEFHQRIMDASARLSQLLGYCVDQLEAQEAKPSATVIRSLSTYSYECAQVFEHYGLIHYRLHELDRVLKTVKETLVDVPNT